VFYIKLSFIILWFLFSSFVMLIVPFALWRPRDLNRDYGRMLSWGVLKILRIQVHIEGAHYIESQKPAVFVVNHQSSFDLITFGEFYPRNTIVIGKKEVGWIPIFGWIYVLAGNVLIDRKKTNQAVAGLSQVAQAIQKKRVSIWIFPEGTRNRKGSGLLPFKKGAFHTAIQAQVPIVPMLSSSLSRLVSWRERKLISGVLQVRVLPPISTRGLGIDQVEKLAEETRKKMNDALEFLESVPASQ
jgi:1-acyl-sn-glycerol-3-phosphate acyltransferase